jgi:hypothetical protein
MWGRTVTKLDLVKPIRATDGQMYHVHAHNCRQAHNVRKYRIDDIWTIDADTVTDVVVTVYPPDQFDYDVADVALGDTMYADDFKFFPCVHWEST